MKRENRLFSFLSIHERRGGIRVERCASPAALRLINFFPNLAELKWGNTVKTEWADSNGCSSTIVPTPLIPIHFSNDPLPLLSTPSMVERAQWATSGSDERTFVALKRGGARDAARHWPCRSPTASLAHSLSLIVLAWFLRLLCEPLFFKFSPARTAARPTPRHIAMKRKEWKNTRVRNEALWGSFFFFFGEGGRWFF